MSRLDKYFGFRLFGHLIFWLAGIAFMLFELYIVSRDTFVFDFNTITKAAIPVLCFAGAVYTNIYLLIPKLLKPRNYIFYAFWLILLMAATSVLIQFLFVTVFKYLLPPESKFSFFDTDMYTRYFFATFFFIGLTSFVKFVKDWLILQDLKLKYEQSERQKLEAELKTLKGQIHPHFLFNSLNNIYSLSLTNSDKVPELILKLSDLMRHIIYESRENFISLSKELEFVDNFLSLQRIRVSDRVKINYSIIGTIPDKRIAPLLFEPFIDNAFKHGLSGFGENEFVSVSFDFTSPLKLIFTIENSFEKSFSIETKYKGIGLTNVKQRLNHLYKENEYSLNISEKGNIFKIKLQLDLKD